MKEENPLSSLLDSIYELEGLVHIALNRDNPPSVLASLIERKAETVATLAREAVAVLPTEDPQDSFGETVPEDMIAEETEAGPEVTESEMAQSEGVREESPLVETSFASETVEIPMETVSPDYHLGEEYSASDLSAYVLPDDEEETEETEEIAESPEIVEGDLDEEYGKSGEREEREDGGEKNFGREIGYVAPPALVKGRGKGKPAFNLNDRYRFRRTLFNGSDAEYQGALAVLAGMESYAEAEAYFIDTLGWNPDNVEVRDFMELLENWYK